MPNDKLMDLLDDPGVLLEAYAASSAYVMREAFMASKQLQVFKRRRDLALAILGRVKLLTRKPRDPVVLGAHLYALELTGADDEIRAATLHVLRHKALQDDPLAGQFAGQIGFNLTHAKKKLAPGTYLAPADLQGVVKALEQKEGQP